MEGMNRVANHINEMARLSEYFGQELALHIPGFHMSKYIKGEAESLWMGFGHTHTHTRTHTHTFTHTHTHRPDLHKEVTWLNAPGSKGKPKRVAAVHLLVFRAFCVSG